MNFQAPLIRHDPSLDRSKATKQKAPSKIPGKMGVTNFLLFYYKIATALNGAINTDPH
jgi:hypothetical protein